MLRFISVYVLLSISALFVYIPSVTHAQFVVEKITDGSLTTSVNDIKLRELSFQKRSINFTFPTSVSFRVKDTTEVSQHTRVWYVNGVDLSKFVTVYGEDASADPADLYTTENKMGNEIEITLTLRNKYLVPGNYTLSIHPTQPDVKPVSATAFVNAAPILPVFSKVRKVLENDRLSILCQVTGYPLPSLVTWYFSHVKPESMNDATVLKEAKANLAPLEGSSESYVFVKNSVTDDQLVFEKLPASFGGLFSCRVENSAGETDESLILVHIKDRWAALWPFIGIVIEVALLVTGILLYERHQMRSLAVKNESATVDAADAISKSVEPSVLQNNVSAVEPHVETMPGGDKLNDGDTADGKQTEDVRLRNSHQC